MECKKCGFDLIKDDLFCPECGSKIKKIKSVKTKSKKRFKKTIIISSVILGLIILMSLFVVAWSYYNHVPNEFVKNDNLNENVKIEKQIVNAPPSEPIEEEIEEEIAEPVITSYTKVAISFGEVQIDWKGTWGKIKSFKYAIKNNNNAGTIEPSYFLIMVEGYDDFEKKVPLSKDSQSLKAGLAVTSYAIIPNGYAYSELSTGDLSSVDITIILYDESDVEMALIKKSVNLEEPTMEFAIE